MDQLVKQLTNLSTKVTAGVLRRIADALDTAEAGVEPVSVHVHIEHYHHTELPDKTVRLPWQKASK